LGLRCGSGLLDERRVGLCVLVQRLHSLTNLNDPQVLFAGSGTDLLHQLPHLVRVGQHVLHRLARTTDHGHPMIDLVHAGRDQLFDLLGRLSTALCQGPDLGRHHGKTPTLLASPGGFNSGVQRQDVGLKSDTVNDPNDLVDLDR
jgi:hypothetical protein